jgi:hypothetical protein
VTRKKSPTPNQILVTLGGASFAALTAASWEALQSLAPYVAGGVAAFGLGAGALHLWRQAETTATHRAENVSRRVKAGNEAERETMVIEHQKRIAAAAAQQMEARLVFLREWTPSGGMAFGNHTNGVIAKQAGSLPVSQADMPPLLDAVKRCDNLLIVGGQGTGKTTLARHIEQRRSASGKTLVIDTHATPDQWSGEVIGAGENYNTVKLVLEQIIKLFRVRHNKRKTGEQLNFERVTVISDEWTLIPRELKNLGYDVPNRYMARMLTGGRKVQMNMVSLTHTANAKPNGLEGEADLKDCFNAIVYLKNTERGRYALVDFGEGKQDTRYALPVPFAESASSIIEGVVKPPISDEDQQAIDAWKVYEQGGASLNATTQAAFGKGKTGANYKAKLRRVLERHGIDAGILG